MDRNGYINGTKIHNVTLNSTGRLPNGNIKRLYTVDLLFPRTTKLNIKQFQTNKYVNITSNAFEWVHTPGYPTNQFEIQVNDNIR